MTAAATPVLIARARTQLHRALLERQTLTHQRSGKSATGYIASNGDAGQGFSATVSDLLAQAIACALNVPLAQAKKKPGQTIGNDFEAVCEQYLRATFSHMQHLRPGRWIIEQVGGRSDDKVSRYAQYSHLAELKRLALTHHELATFLGNGYTIAPDVIIARQPESDATINGGTSTLVDDNVATLSCLRAANAQQDTAEEILHASISCKFTMRSDRAQNTRTEALNLIRNRKGRTPHIVAVTAEPTPSRIASLALGTGDLDCVYHFALHELRAVLAADNRWGSHLEQLDSMIAGKRLKDIGDLPLDLAV